MNDFTDEPIAGANWPLALSGLDDAFKYWEKHNKGPGGQGDSTRQVTSRLLNLPYQYCFNRTSVKSEHTIN